MIAFAMRKDRVGWTDDTRQRHLKLNVKRVRTDEHKARCNAKKKAKTKENKIQEAEDKMLQESLTPQTIVRGDYNQLKRARKLEVDKLLKGSFNNVVQATLPNTDEEHHPSIIKNLFNKSPLEENVTSIVIDLIKNAMQQKPHDKSTILQQGSLLLAGMEKPTKKSFEGLLGN